MTPTSSPGPARSLKPRYVLATAAYNEEAYIDATIRSVIAQTVPPLKWVIVSDGSTDRTDEIVRSYSESHQFIQLHRITEEHPRDFSAQVLAINSGFAELEALGFEFIGNLDADITLEPEYFEKLLERFDRDPKLGLAGGSVCEKIGNEFQPRNTNCVRSVPHAVQLFRRECMNFLGGYLALPYGGPDWHAEVTVRMHGWKVQSFPDLAVYHHRRTGTSGGLLRYSYRQGHMDYSVGSLPLFELLKLARRLRARPYVLVALARLCGYILANLRREPRMVSDQFVEYLRREQRGRIWPKTWSQRGTLAAWFPRNTL